jgi:hypothetical protein
MGCDGVPAGVALSNDSGASTNGMARENARCQGSQRYSLTAERSMLQRPYFLVDRTSVAAGFLPGVWLWLRS